MKLSPSSIKWLKSVSDTVNNGAYLDVKDKLDLHFVARHREGATKPECGDIILLFQRIDNDTR